MPLILPEHPGAEPAVEALLDRAFGPERHLKTAERLREGGRPAPGLAFLAIDDDAVIGTLRFWAVRLGDLHRAVLLGPLAVDRQRHGEGLGSALVCHGLRRARQLGHAAVILVGDEPYYRRFGFSAEPTRRLTLPGPVDRRRFLGLDLVPGAMDGVTGPVTSDANWSPAPIRRAA